MKKIKKLVLCITLAVLMILNSGIPVAAEENSTSSNSFKVSGFVKPDFAFPNASTSTLCSDFKIEIEGTQLSTTSDENGYFEINGVPQSTDGYKFLVSKSYFLTRIIDKVIVDQDIEISSQDVPITVWAGDIVINGTQDNSINMSDVLAVASAFNSIPSNPKYLKGYDLNLDNAVNMSDIFIIAKNFNKISSNYPRHMIQKLLPLVGSYENLKNILAYNNNFRPIPTAMAMPTRTPAPVATPSPAASGTDYSKTNNQVNGVDEGDIVQTDGEYIYQVNKNKVIIAKAYPAKEMSISSTLDFKDTNFTPIEMHIDFQRLVVIGRTSVTSITPLPTGYMGYPQYPTKTYTSVIIYDISDKTDIKQIRKLDLEGSYFSSRKIDSMLYVVANKAISYGIMNKEEDTKPTYRDTLIGESFNQVDYNVIRYFPEAVNPNYMVIAGIDIFNMGQANISAYLGAGQKIYVSLENMYIAETNYLSVPIPMITSSPQPLGTPPPNVTLNYQNTLIYKFTLNNGKAFFVNKGEVSGRILNQFSMDEYNSYFRVATNNSYVSPMVNSLYVLDQNLKQTGKIDNLAPGENIYSTRFMGEKAFIVTFRRVDPLFVIDLKDVYNPKVLGELKIEGYSEYLQPYDENHLIGFGQDTVNGRVTGIKLALFDVTDVTNPIQKFSTSIGSVGTNSQVSYNHKAFLFDKEKNLLAFPIEVTDYSANNGYIKSTFQGAYVYNIDLVNGFNLKGKVAHVSFVDYPTDYYYYTDYNSVYDKYIERVMYIDNNLYTLSKKFIKANSLEDLSELNTLEIPQPSYTPIPSPSLIPVTRVTPTPV